MHILANCGRAFVIFLLLGSCATAQTTSVVDGTVPLGIGPAASYPLSGFEHYDPFSGSLNPSLPLHHIGGRGEAGFDLVWNFQQTWVAAKRYGGSNPFIPIDPYPDANVAGPQGGAAGPLGAGAVFSRTGSAFLSCPNVGSAVGSTLTRIVFEEPNGAQVELASTLNGNVYSISNACNQTPASVDAGRGMLFKSTDGSALQFLSDSNVLDYTSPGFGEADTKVSGYLVFPNGITYRIDNAQVSWIRDRNGNKITLEYNSSAQVYVTWYLPVNVLSQITDSLGRITTINYSDSSCGGCTTITYPGAGGASRAIQIVQAHLSSGLLRPDYSSVTSIDQLFPNTGQPTYNFDPILASYIQFPDGRRFTFQYNPHGELARISLPTGGAIEYDYGDGHNAGADGFEGVTTDNNPVMIYRRLQQRREYANGGNGGSFTSKTQYPVSYQSSNLTAEEQVYDPSGNLVSQTVHTLHGSPLDALTMSGTSCNPWNEGLETQTDYGAPSALMTVVHYWTEQSGCRSNPQLSSQTTILDDTNQVSQQGFAYDAYNNVTDLYEYDWGTGSQGSLIRHTQMAYFWSTNATFSGTASYLVRLPYYRIVYDSNGNQVAETSWHYDENPVQDAPGIFGHDSNYGAGWNTRGNATSEWQWLKNQSGSWTAVGTLRTFDIAGNVLTQQDPNGNVTAFAYNDDGANEYAFPTSTTNPLGQKITIAYDYNVGKPVQTTNANGVNTAASYNDPLDRLTQVTRASGVSGLESQTNYSYPGPNQITGKQDQNTEGDGALVTTQLYDGLGRESTTQQYESGSSFIEVDKTYDAMGRIYTVSNPYRSGDAVALTTYLYDTLGRATSVAKPDGAATSTTYSGQYQFVTDAGGNSKRYWYDAAGRLYNVLEDPASINPNGFNYTTDYRYDVLDDLVLVSQGYCPNCRQRQYTYDALRRLTQATNPESGTDDYSYDANGNLTTRTDARGVTTTYAYDGLNRLASKTYSDSTLAVSYTYDDPVVSHSVGQLTQVANGNSTTKYLGYDALGRITSNQQITSDETYTFSYTYNLSRSLISETYPSGRVVTTAYDGANRANSTTGILAGQRTPYASGISYAPHGAPLSFTIGNGISPGFTYNNRLQISSLCASIGDNSGCSNTGSSPYLFYDSPNWGTTNNNGNLLGETIWKGGPGPLNSLLQSTRTYSYDTLNRLSTASDSSGWGRQFGYDAWGNGWMTANSGVTAAGNTPTANVYNSNNQTTGASYDNAGNLLSVNDFTLRYDAENRQTSAAEQPSLGGGQDLYLYDGDGQRVEKVGMAGNTVYVYDAFGQLVAEYNTFASSFACVTCYITTDQLGSVRMVTDQNGTPVTRHDFLPFGEEIPETSGSTDVEQRFTGQTRDTETGMDYFNARYYAAPLGRFNSVDPGHAGADPTDPQTWNGYSYVRNNPLTYTDPTGESFLSIFKEIATAIAAIAGVLSGLGVAWAAPVAQVAGFASGQAQIAGIIANHSVPSVVAAPLSERVPLPVAVSNPGQFANDYRTDLHLAMTYDAALAAGMDRFSASWLASRVANVDNPFSWPGSQGTDAAHTHWHAMGGQTGHGAETCSAAYAGTVSALGDATRRAQTGDQTATALAIHMIQDSYASGHQYQLWSGGVPSLAHRAGDAVWSQSPETQPVGISVRLGARYPCRAPNRI